MHPRPITKGLMMPSIRRHVNPLPLMHLAEPRLEVLGMLVLGVHVLVVYPFVARSLVCRGI